jgi:hypothetical protein
LATSKHHYGFKASLDTSHATYQHVKGGHGRLVEASEMLSILPELIFCKLIGFAFLPRKLNSFFSDLRSHSQTLGDHLCVCFHDVKQIIIPPLQKVRKLLKLSWIKALLYQLLGQLNQMQEPFLLSLGRSLLFTCRQAIIVLRILE